LQELTGQQLGTPRRENEQPERAPELMADIPPWLLLDPLLQNWLREDIGRGDWSTQGLELGDRPGEAIWVARAGGIICGLPIAARCFQVLNPATVFDAQVAEGRLVEAGTEIARLSGPLSGLLMGERVALNLAMRLGGIATATRQLVEHIKDLPTQFVDTRKTTPGLRILEKYATRVGGGINHRLGLDDAVMVKENHIAAAGGILEAMAQLRQTVPYPLSIEIEAESIEQVMEALEASSDIIMLDNMPLDLLRKSVRLIRSHNAPVKIEASGNITLETIRPIAKTGVDYISSSAPITRSPWLDLSMRIIT
jgi:nicotinate-nucleotide pyrophosphorylase (carboxylating)